MAGTASGWNRGSNAHRAHRNIIFDISLWQRKIPLFISSLSPLPSSFYRLHKAEFQRQWPSYFIFGTRGGPLPARASTRMDEKSEERAGEITNEERNSKLNSPEMQLRNAEAQVWMKNRRPIDLLRYVQLFEGTISKMLLKKTSFFIGFVKRINRLLFTYSRYNFFWTISIPSIP